MQTGKEIIYTAVHERVCL